MIVLAIDTCDARGSVGVLRGQEVLGLEAHERAAEEYSSWLLPTVEGLLKRAGLRMSEVGGYAVAAGPGSFTGVRVGLTTVKAWAEVYGKPVAAVSRLEAIAVQAAGEPEYVAAFADAQRGQVFGAVYERKGPGLSRMGEEMVIAPGRFVEATAELAAGGGRISWVSPDGGVVRSERAWKVREKGGERIEAISATLAAVIGRIGVRQLLEGRVTDALRLDANYVRRSDAEVFWKGGATAETRRERAYPAIRALRIEDAAAVAEILREAPQAVFWPEASVREVLGWAGTVGIASETGGQVTGFVMGRQTGEEAEVLNLAVAPGRRRRGEGGGLLDEVVAELRARGASHVFLEVRESNEAGIAFYEKHGFSKTGRREGYYRDPAEAAIVMEKKLAC